MWVVFGCWRKSQLIEADVKLRWAGLSFSRRSLSRTTAVDSELELKRSLNLRLPS